MDQIPNRQQENRPKIADSMAEILKTESDELEDSQPIVFDPSRGFAQVA